MPARQKYDEKTKYIVTGATLNDLYREIDTRTLLNGPGYRVDTIPGTGSRLNIRPSTTLKGLWDLSVVDPETASIKIVRDGRVKRTTALDATGLVTIVDIAEEFTAVEDHLLVLECVPDPDDGLIVTLKMVEEWDGWPFPMDTAETDPAGFWVVTKYYYPLYDIRAVTEDTDYDDPDVFPINDTLVAERRHHGSHLQFELTRQEDKDGHVVSAFHLTPSVGCRRA